MGPYKGDYTTSDTVRFMFDSFSSDDPSASVTITGFAVADILIYKDGSATQRSSTSGFTATTDFDSITGVHLVAIDLSDNTDAGFFADGSEYEVVISSVTIDGATINFHLGSFSIGRIPRVNVTQISDDSTAANNCESFFDGTGYAGTGNTIPTVTTVTNDVGVNEWNGVALATTNPLPNAAAGAAGGLPTDSTGKTSFNDITTAQVNTEVDTALADIGLDHLISSALPTSWAVDVAANSVFDQIADDGTAAYDRTTDSLQAIADSGGGGPTAAQIADAVWDEQLSGHTTAGSGGKALSDIDTNIPQTLNLTASGNIGIDWANVENQGSTVDLSATDFQLVDTASTVSNSVTIDATSVDAIWDEALSGHTTANTTGNVLRQIFEGVISEEASVNDVSATTTAFITNLTETTTSHYSDLTLMFIDGNLKGQAKPIQSYDGGTKTITLDEALTEAPANGDSFIILALYVHPTSQIADAVLDEALSGHTTAGTLGKAVADIETDATAILVDTASIGITKNQAFSNLEFLMVDETDHVTPETGLTVTGQRRIDGGAFASVSGTITEASNGIYQFDALAADTNGDTITYRFSATGAADTFITIKTRA